MTRRSDILPRTHVDDDLQQAYDAGWDAYVAGVDPNKCPLPACSAVRVAWQQGNRDAMLHMVTP